MIIKLKFEQGDPIGPTILNLCDNIDQLSKINNKKNNIIDLSEMRWISPLSILPVASLLFELQAKGGELSVIKPNNLNTKSYLRTIKFFEGAHTIDYLERHRSYIPIVSLPNKPTEVKNREQVEAYLKDILLEKINCKRNLSNTVGYALAEMFGNIWEHSKTKYGWFLAQYYKSKNYVDICFLDNGISIRGSYTRKEIKTTSDAGAIKLALKGKSTKVPEIERGYGLWTTRRLITESLLKGEFLILSGRGGYYKSREKELLFNLKCYWKGTIVLLRINRTKRKIDYTRYIE